MDGIALLGVSVAFSFVAFAWVMRLYAWPHLQAMSRESALQALIAPHMFRFIGLSFLVPGVVGTSLPSAFAVPAAYGDLAATVLSMIAMVALSARTSWAIGAVWVFNVVGMTDLLFAFYQGLIAVGLPSGALGAAFYIPTMIVPPLLVTHAMIFWLLVRIPTRAVRHADRML